MRFERRKRWMSWGWRMVRLLPEIGMLMLTACWTSGRFPGTP